MDEFIVAIVLVAVVIVGGTFAVGTAITYRNNRAGHSAPSSAATRGAVLAAQAKVSYHIAQQAVRILDALVADDMTRVVIPESTQEQIKKISKDFYSL